MCYEIVEMATAVLKLKPVEVEFSILCVSSDQCGPGAHSLSISLWWHMSVCPNQDGTVWYAAAVHDQLLPLVLR